MSNNKTRSCDNCALMHLRICKDGLLHRYCTALSRYIADWNIEAVCGYHKLIAVKGVAK